MMVWQILLSALALVFIVEGLMPALFPEHYQKMMRRVVLMSLKSLRSMGLCSLIVGAIVMLLVHSGII